MAHKPFNAKLAIAKKGKTKGPVEQVPVPPGRETPKKGLKVKKKK